jgi:hypothetical protein
MNRTVDTSFLQVGESSHQRQNDGPERFLSQCKTCPLSPSHSPTPRDYGNSDFCMQQPLSEDDTRVEASPSSHPTAYSSDHRESSGAPVAIDRQRPASRRQGGRGGDDEDPKPFESMLLDGLFDEALSLLAKRPGLARQEAGMICQGERSRAFPLHLALADPLPSMELVDALVTCHPAALTSQESAGSRTPLQIALWKCQGSAGVLRYLVNARPQALEQSDRQGNLPLHTAIFYSQPNDVLEFLLGRYPPACRHENDRGKLPIHLYCSQGWIRDSSSRTATSLNIMLRKLVEAYPESLRHPDKEGRLPLHVACSCPYPCWQLLCALMDAYPAALLSQTNSGKTPLQLLRQMTITKTAAAAATGSGSFQESHVVLAMVRDRTARERRRLGAKRGSGVVVKLFRKRAPAAATASSSIDLYNCYG